MTEIRHAQVNDIPQLIIMGREFWSHCEMRHLVEYNPGTIEALYQNIIGGDEHVALVVEDKDILVGVATALVFPCWMNSDVLTSQEINWWLDPDYRGGRLGLELLDALENAVLEKGAGSFMMVALDNLEPDRLAKLYARRGYVPFEHTFLRGLNGCRHSDRGRS